MTRRKDVDEQQRGLFEEHSLPASSGLADGDRCSVSSRSPSGAIAELVSDTERKHLAEVQERLAAELPGMDRERIGAAIAVEYAQFEGRPIRDFIPLFVERRARQALQLSS